MLLGALQKTSILRGAFVLRETWDVVVEILQVKHNLDDPETTSPASIPGKICPNTDAHMI
jgi:hypothetical protein